MYRKNRCYSFENFEKEKTAFYIARKFRRKKST